MTRRPQYALAGGEFNLTLSQGDIYTGDTTPPPNNFILQDASHAGADWVIETKINDYTHDGGYAQGGLLAYGRRRQLREVRRHHRRRTTRG